MFANNTEYLHNLVLFFLASYCQTRPKNTFALPVDRPVVGQTRALSPSLYNENNETLKWRKRMKADKLILNATKINEYEEERNERMREILSEKLGTILLVEYKKNRQKCKSDGVLTTSLGTLIAYLGILEGKNEIETDKNDPTIQEALYYRDYWSQDNKLLLFPSFIITVAGPWFYILGGVFLNRAVVELLTDFIPLAINLRVFDKKKQITRLFYSLYQALRLLNNFYRNLGVERSVDHRFFPYVCQFQSDGNNIISFTDIYELLDDPTRTIWKGTDENANRL
ncbi:hypothetical protein RhiirC2_708129 [Rhizophagus irregularis]|uniref:Uncharacterized protein n=1 Tax=Rhizophagus irregularis TaxID=588596 RepID=A0A2N1NNF8_9GLOM|nr:hypothetical protein RhiirC2_708129 [Rhizophagus irregularis]